MNIQHRNNIESMSIQRHDVESTLIKYWFNIVCPRDIFMVSIQRLRINPHVHTRNHFSFRFIPHTLKYNMVHPIGIAWSKFQGFATLRFLQKTMRTLDKYGKILSIWTDTSEQTSRPRLYNVCHSVRILGALLQLVIQHYFGLKRGESN